MAKEAVKLPSKMALEDVTAALPSNVVESTVSLSMRCSKCNGLNERESFCFFHGLKRQRLYALIKGICEFHPKSQYSIPLWDKINRLDSMDKELIAKLMFFVGNCCYVNPSAFNLFTGCQTQWTFFETCTLPDPIPEFASPDLLSRPLSEHATVSWEKVLYKLSEALQDETLSQLSMLRAMLACRILITLEKNESCKGSLRLNGTGKKLLTEVLPCSYASSRVWPASSILFYLIFDFMKRVSIVDQALNSAMRQNTVSAESAGYKLVEVRLKKHDTIEIDLKPSSCTHEMTVQSAFDKSSCLFPVAPKACTSCAASKVQKPTGFNFEGGRRLYQVMHLFQMFINYVKHINHGETPREMILATILYILKTGASSNPKALPMEYLDDTHEAIANHVEEHGSRPIKPPIAALDYRTNEGRHSKRKKPIVDIEMPEEIQTIKTYVEGLKICASKHGSGKPPRFQEECDGVAERLTQQNETTLDVDLRKMPSAMRPALRSSPKRQASKSEKRKRPLFESEDEEEDDDEDEKSSPAKSERKRCQLDSVKKATVSGTKTCAPTADVGRPRLPSQPKSTVPKLASKNLVPLSAAVSARVEKVVLENSQSVTNCTPMETDGDNRGENDCRNGSNGAINSESGNENDDESDSESDSGSDSESGDDSDDDSEEGDNQEQSKADGEERGESAIRSSPLNTPVRDVAETEYRLQTPSPKKLRVEIPRAPIPMQVSRADSRPVETRNLPEPKQTVESREPHQKRTPDTSCSVQTSLNQANTSPDEVPSSVRQLSLSESVVEEVPLYMPPPQLQSQQHTIEFGESDVEELFNGTDDKQDTTENWLELVNEIPPKTLMDPVSSEIVTRGEPVKGQGNITVGPVSLDTAQRAICVTKILREVGGLSDMVPSIELAYTFNGEVAFRVGTDQKQLYSLDTFPGDWTTIQSFSNLLRVIVMSAALQSLDPTDLSRFWITSEKRVVCLPSTTGRVEMKIHPMDLLLAVPDIGRRFRQAVRADVAGFAAWIRSMTAEEKGKIETIAREANLTARDQSKTIDLDYFCRFFNNFVSALPWIEGK